MKFLPLRYLTVSIILLFLSGISEGQLTVCYNEQVEISFSNNSENEPSEKSSLNFELRENESHPLSHGEKVETTVIPGPASNYSKAQNISFNNLREISSLKKKYSLISHFNILISRALHKSPLVNILRI